VAILASPKKISLGALTGDLVTLIRGDTVLELDSSIVRGIAPDVKFVDWCEDLTKERRDPVTGRLRPALKVDGQPFQLSDRPAMRWIYEQIPSTPAEAFRMTLTLMKCAQVGFTVLEMLAAVYFALKFEPLKIGMFLPDMNLARGKSSVRFMPIVRTVPEAYERLTADRPDTKERSKGEGNVMTREMGASLFHFLWTSGKATTESYPMDVVSFDEVQEMLIADMEKAQERLSASKFKFTLMGSTANWPDADIDHWYKKGTRYRFHTRCPTCGVEEPLDGYFPACIVFDPAFPDRVTGIPGDYRYVCREGHWIDEPQAGEWKAENPEAALRKNISIHFHQMLSPTISPREMYEAFINADDLKNFYNRKLGKPYQDPSQIPVTLEMLNACAAEGMRQGLVWKTRARGAYMGIDQMGAFNVVIIKERLPDGRQAVIHVEEIYSADPFARCDELMDLYGISICVVETLPNYNDAHRFATRFPGRVFLAQYGDMKDDAMRWGDGPKLDVNERRTSEDERTRYTVTLDQYKCMSLTLARLVHQNCLFPDPAALVQEVRDKGVRRQMALLKERVFLHFQRTALVTERLHDGERKYRRKVVKVGIDPHFSYANMLCDIAFSRAHGTATFLIPEGKSMIEERRTIAEQKNLHGLPGPVAAMFEPLPPGQICGNCTECPMGPHGAPEKFQCTVRYAEVRSRDPGCDMFMGAAHSGL
jgi:hypothetical protein